MARRYIGPFEITDRIGEVIYRLAFPSELTGVHNVLHMPMLKKNVADVERPMCIIDTKEQVLHTKMTSWVKVLWENHTPRNHLGAQGSDARVSLSFS